MFGELRAISLPVLELTLLRFRVLFDNVPAVEIATRILRDEESAWKTWTTEAAER